MKNSTNDEIWELYHDWKDRVDKLLDKFTEEIITYEPEFFAETKIMKLNAEIMKIYNDICWWLFQMDKYNEDLFRQLIMVNIIDPLWKKAEQKEDEIRFYEKPKKIEYDRITQSDIDHAKSVDCANFLETRRRGSISLAICPFHDDHKPSLHCYPDGHYHCYTCDAHGNAINLIMHLKKYSFVEAVKHLRGG